MKTLCFLTFLALIRITISPVNAEVEDVSITIEESGFPELDRSVRDFLSKDADLDEKVASELDIAKEKYLSVLDTLLHKADHAGKVEDGDRIRAEIKRWEKEGFNTSPSEALPAPVRKAWKTLEESLEKASGTVAPQRNNLRAAFARSLSALDKGYLAEGNAAAVAAVRQVRTCASLRIAIEKEQIAFIGSESRPSDWKDLAEDGGFIVGFDAGKGSWSDKPVLGRFKPIYQTIAGRRDGRHDYGKAPSSGRFIAKDGYAVGGLLVRDRESNDGRKVVGSVRIMFMKILPDGSGLDPKDVLYSPWAGGEGGSKQRELTGKGRFIVGIKGKSGDVTDSITLISQK